MEGTKMLLLVYFFSNCLILTQEDIKSIEYSSVLGYVNLEVLLGNPVKRKYFEADMENNLTYVGNNFYHQSNSKLIHSEGQCSHEGVSNLSYYLYSDRIRLDDVRDKQFDNFYFYFFNKSFYQFDSISFALQIEDERTSLIHQLYTNDIIDNKQFGFIRDGKNSNGHLYLGGFPTEKVNGLNAVEIKVNPNRQRWGNIIEKIKFRNNKEYISGEYGYFTTKIGISAPLRFFDYLEFDLFLDYFNNGSCMRTSYQNKKNIFECDCEIFKQTMNLTFVIDNKYINVDESLLFHPTLTNKCRLKIDENKSENVWKIGFNFLEENPTLFNYETKSMTIYSKAFYPENKRESIFILTIFFISTNAIMIGFLLLYKWKKLN